MLKNSLFIIIALFGLLGCSSRQYVTQNQDIAYVKFNKDSNKSYEILINKEYKIKLGKCTVNEQSGQCYDENADTVYKVKSGLVNIEIKDDKGILIYSKEIFIGSLNTYEVDLK